LNTKVVGFVGVVPGDGTKVWERYIWTRGGVGEESKGKETDGCPLTARSIYR
jgi:hypothetical protein